jgi:hypothetical protein
MSIMNNNIMSIMTMSIMNISIMSIMNNNIRKCIRNLPQPDVEPKVVDVVDDVEPEADGSWPN